MNILLGPVNSGRTTIMLQKAREIASKDLPVLVVSDELGCSDITNLGGFTSPTPVSFHTVRTMTDILSAIGTTSRFQHIFIDVSFLDMRDMEFLNSLSDYTETDMTLAIQTSRGAIEVGVIELSFEALKDLGNKRNG